MWFKQIQLFQLTSPISSSASTLAEKLAALAFTPCLPSMPSSIGWVPPIDEEGAPLAVGVNGCLMICLQIEEKILPSNVVNQHLKEKVKRIEQAEGRKVRHKEKLSYKDEMVYTLLPRAFSKFTTIYAYIDTRHKWLIVNSTSPNKTELFLSLFKKSVTEDVAIIDVIKPSSILTPWLKSHDNPKEFSVEKTCVLQDPEQQTRVIRCQQQDLYAASIQSLVKDGCEAIQLGLCWHDRLTFVLADDFSLRSIRLAEDDLAEINEEIETKLQKFTADLLMMSEMLSGLIKDLLTVFQKNSEAPAKLAKAG